MQARQSETGINESASPASVATQTLCIQKKLEIGSVNDPLEHEADAMADTVMSMQTASPAMAAKSNSIQRKCRGCEKEDEKERIQRKPLASFIQKKESAGGTVASDNISNQINSGKGNGNSMDATTRSFMESRFGTDFSDVKIHTGNEAIQMNRELSARAFTAGNDIYFNKEQYQPGSDTGKQLLAHELTHTLQQASTIQRDPLPTGTHTDVQLDPDVIRLIITRAQERLGDISLTAGLEEPASLIPPLLGERSGLPSPALDFTLGYSDRCNRSLQSALLGYNQPLDGQTLSVSDNWSLLGSLGLRIGKTRFDGSVSASFQGNDLQALTIAVNVIPGVSDAIPDECKGTPPAIPGTGGGGGTTDLCAGIDCDQPSTIRSFRHMLCCIGRPPQAPATPDLPSRTVYFYYDTSIAKPQSNDTLALLADTMRMLPSVHLQITGHTSMEGTEPYNQQLSQSRADFVKSYLLLQSIDSSRIDVMAMGENVPAVAEPPEPMPRTLRLPQQEAVRDLNRRAEVVFFDPSGKLPFLPASVPFILTVPDLSLSLPGRLRSTERFLPEPHLRWGTGSQ